MKEQKIENIIVKKISFFPESLKKEVLDFINFLEKKYIKKKKDYPKSLTFNWAGDLKEYKNKFSSIALQKKAIEWRKNI